MHLEHYLIWAAAFTAVNTLFTMSELFEPVRRRLPVRPFSCPICTSYWVCTPALYWGLTTYLAVVTFSILWVFVVAKTYNELADFEYDTPS